MCSFTTMPTWLDVSNERNMIMSPSAAYSSGSIISTSQHLAKNGSIMFVFSRIPVVNEYAGNRKSGNISASTRNSFTRFKQSTPTPGFAIRFIHGVPIHFRLVPRAHAQAKPSQMPAAGSCFIVFMYLLCIVRAGARNRLETIYGDAPWIPTFSFGTYGNPPKLERLLKRSQCSAVRLHPQNASMVSVTAKTSIQ